MRWTNTVTIDAPADVVWRLTLDIEHWPSYTSTMQRVTRLDSGPIEIGSSARVKQPAQPTAVWTVTRLVPGREFTWQTKRMGMTMTGTHLVEAVGDQCRNTLIIDVTGRGSRVYGAAFGAAFRWAIGTENAGFKKAAEQLGHDLNS